tara:strand:+ start:1174 stop:1485 length:312 start_codon:yes stop_codon:yes gene_type:complete
MKSGYEITWTAHALEELKHTFEYLEENWTHKELHRLSVEIENTLNLISKAPKLFQSTDKKNVRRAVVLKLNTIFFLIKEKDNTIEILSFFNNRRNPEKAETGS